MSLAGTGLLTPPGPAGLRVDRHRAGRGGWGRVRQTRRNRLLQLEPIGPVPPRRSYALGRTITLRGRNRVPQTHINNYVDPHQYPQIEFL